MVDLMEVVPVLAPTAPPKVRRHVVVCVDDEPQVLAALRRILWREPYDVVTLDTPEDVLAYVEERQVSIVIADERMPEMKGSDLLREVGIRSPFTARVILTGYPEQVCVEGECVQRLLTKPWNDEQLRRTIRALLRERERRE